MEANTTLNRHYDKRDLKVKIFFCNFRFVATHTNLHFLVNGLKLETTFLFYVSNNLQNISVKLKITSLNASKFFSELSWATSEGLKVVINIRKFVKHAQRHNVSQQSVVSSARLSLELDSKQFECKIDFNSINRSIPRRKVVALCVNHQAWNIFFISMLIFYTFPK